MAIPVVLTPAALQDIEDMKLYLAQRSETVASRFTDSINKSFNLLSQMPYLGELHPFKDPLMQNIRIWRVKGFPNHLIFYRVEPEQITIARLRHSATNYMEDFESENV